MCSLWIINYKHKFIIAINFFFFFFLLLAIFIYFEWYKWYKVPTMLLEILFVHCYKLFLLLLVLFLYLLKIVYYCLWGINEFVVFLCIVHVWFWFFYPFTQIFIISHKGTIFSQYKNSVSEYIFFFRYKNVASKSFYQNKIYPFPLMLMQRNEM
jgi:hypothetical protein